MEIGGYRRYDADGSLGIRIVHSADQYPFENFENLSEILQRSHGTVIERLNTLQFASGYGRPLGEALRDAAPTLQVVRLDIRIGTFFRRGGQQQQHYNHDDALPMLDYVRTSKSLRYLCLEEGMRRMEVGAEEPLVVQLLRAAAKNPNLESLKTMRVFLPATELANFLTTTTSLQVLDLDHRALALYSSIGAFFGPRGNPVEMERLEDAFVANRSIKRLSLAYGGPFVDPFMAATDVYDPIVQRLDSRNTGTTSDIDVRVAICIYMQRDRLNTMLQYRNTVDKLRLCKGELLEEDIDILSENHSLTELALSEMTINLPAARKLIHFISKDANRNGNSLCNLVIDRCTITLDAAARSDFPNLLVGSALESFELGERPDEPSGHLVTPDFFAALSANISKIQARRLEFNSIEYHTGISMTDFLAKTGRVEECKASFSFTGRSNSSRAVRDLRANGSLLSVIFSMVTVSIFTAEQQRRVDLYLKRNSKLPALFNLPSIFAAGTSQAVAKNSDGDGATNNDADYMRLFPTLFAVAKDGRGTAANNILKGLKSMAETFSSTRQPRDRVRARTSSDETSNEDVDQKQH